MPPATNLRPRLTREESVGLIVAAAVHAGLIASLALHPLGKPVNPPPERMTVTLSDASAPQPASPELGVRPVAAPRPEPRLTMAPAEPDALAVPEPDRSPPLPSPGPAPPRAARRASEPVARPSQEPAPKPAAKPRPGPSPAPAAKPAVKPSPRPSPAPAAKPPAKPIPRQSSAPAAKSPAPKSSREATKSTAKATPAPKAQATNKGAPEGERGRRPPESAARSSRIGSDFLKGVESELTDRHAAATPAVAAGPQVAASLSRAITRQLKRQWKPPQGADAEKLVTVLAWELKPDGSLAGRPRVVSQSGVTPTNRAQKKQHAEQAIRAVQRAAPFRLPSQHYASWRRVAAFRFDRKLGR